MGTNVILLLILLGIAAAVVVFTFVFVILVDRSLARTRGEDERPPTKDRPETDRS